MIEIFFLCVGGFTLGFFLMDTIRLRQLRNDFIIQYSSYNHTLFPCTVPNKPEMREQYED